MDTPNERLTIAQDDTKMPSPQEINSLLTLFAEGRYPEAASLAQTLTIRFPLHEFAWKVLGAVLKLMGRNADALEPMQKAAALAPDDAEAHSNLGVTLKGLGRLDEAVTCYRRALEIDPNDAEAHHNLGGALQGLGRLNDAEASYRRTLEIKPDFVETHNNLGLILHDLGRPEEAEACYRRALDIKPDYTEAQCNLGKALKIQGRLDEAEACYRQILQIRPDYAEMHYNLGCILQDLSRIKEAEACFRRAVQINPGYVQAHNNLGNSLMGMGRLDEAETCFRQALQINPDYAEAHINLGCIHQQLGRLVEAAASYRRTLEIKPYFADAYNNLSNILIDLGQLDEAEACCRQAIKINPNFAEALNNLGCICQKLGRLAEAAKSFRLALEIDPNLAETYYNLGIALNNLSRLDEAEASYRRALELKPDHVAAHSNLIFTLDLMADVDSASLHEERKRWNAAHAAHLHQQLTHCNTPDPERRIRIGYVSADLRRHSAPKAFGAMLTRYDRSQFEVFAYSNLKEKSDDHTELFRQNVTVWRNIIGLSNDAVATMIREDQIDILVDLSGYSAGNRLLVFARKPAPIQITAWGYAAGTGMQAMDVLFTDRVLVPPEDKRYFTEEVRYLPNVMGAFFIDSFPDVNKLPALSNGFVTFGSLNRLAKVSDNAYRAWAEVLLAIPRSRLILKTPELNDVATREQVSKHFINVGVTADRIVLLGKTSWYEHMQAYRQIDIGLDPFPQGGGVTALEGLMMGVPIINLLGATLAGKVSASVMTTLGLSDWIAKNREEYIELAVRKTADLQSLAALRQQLRGIFTSSAIGDQIAYARVVEQEYRKLWQEWCSRV